MINAVSFINTVRTSKPLSFKGINVEPDRFIMSNEAKLRLAEERARKNILANMQDGREHAYLLSYDGRILAQTIGTEDACSVDLKYMDRNCVLIHGHPQNSPLSPQDVITFLTCKNLQAVEAISSDGKISRLTKTSATADDYDYFEAGFDISYRFCLNILDGLGIDYRDNKSNLIKYGRKLLEKYFGNMVLDDEQVIKLLRELGVYKDSDLKGSCNELCKRLSIFDNNFSKNLAQRIINENMELITNETYTPIGIKAGNDALYEIARDYNLIYDSTFFSE